jgi:hypothetical protein
LKVTMNTLAKGPNVHYDVGQTYDVPDDLGRQFIDGRYAVLAEQPKPKAAEPEPAKAVAPKPAEQQKKKQTPRGES